MRRNLILSAVITQDNFDVNLKKKNKVLIKEDRELEGRLLSKFITNLLVCLLHLTE